MEKSAAGTYDYDIHITTSIDGGINWSKSFLLNRDGLNAEHGFVTILPYGDKKFFACWLDGRNTKGQAVHGHDHVGAMSLRGAFFDSNGNILEDTELDNKVCDCCQTDAAITDEGIIVVYRDRSEDEIRDIYSVQYNDITHEWSEPEAVSNDSWKISGCPVNGPAISSFNNSVAVAWFTMASDTAQVKMVFSADSGKTFAKPIRVDHGNPLGRIDIKMINEDKAYMSWIEKTDNTAFITISEINLRNMEFKNSKSLEVDPSRSSGFPKISEFEDKILLAWIDNENQKRIKTGLIEFIK